MFDKKPNKPRYIVYCTEDGESFVAGRVSDVLRNETGDVECYVVTPLDSLVTSYVKLKQVFRTADDFDDVLGIMKPFEALNNRLRILANRVNKLEVQSANAECRCKGKCHGKS